MGVPICLDEFAPQAVLAAEGTVEDYALLPNGTLDPATAGVISWRLDFEITRGELLATAGIGATAAAFYAGAGVARLFSNAIAVRYA